MANSIPKKLRSFLELAWFIFVSKNSKMLGSYKNFKFSKIERNWDKL